VLLACGVEEKYAQGTIRVSIGRYTTEKEVDYFLETLPEAVKKIRSISPMNLREDF
jgi:cysteine desulfurase